jgi:hypothetical protein
MNAPNRAAITTPISAAVAAAMIPTAEDNKWFQAHFDDHVIFLIWAVIVGRMGCVL